MKQKTEQFKVYFDSYRNMMQCIHWLKDAFTKYNGISVYDFLITCCSACGIVDDDIMKDFGSGNIWMYVSKYYSIDDIYNIKIDQVYNGWYFCMNFPN